MDSVAAPQSRTPKMAAAYMENVDLLRPPITGSFTTCQPTLLLLKVASITCGGAAASGAPRVATGAALPVWSTTSRRASASADRAPGGETCAVVGDLSIAAAWRDEAVRNVA